MKKIFALLMALNVIISVAAFPATAEIVDNPEKLSETEMYRYQVYASMSPEEIVAEMTLEQKVSQMVQPISYKVDDGPIREYCYGSIYGDEAVRSAAQWREISDGYQAAAISSESGIPLLLAQDNAHGVGYCVNAVIFPHNIGIGAANDEELVYQMGRITAEETKQCHMLWNLFPCVAQSNDPRWGRTYECISSDLNSITRLSTAYTRGLIDGGVIACAKHYFGDGNVLYGTGEESDYIRLLDRGNAVLSDQQVKELLSVYQAQIDAGVQTIMVSYSSLNGVKMHENSEYIWKLKTDMGFQGIIVSDSMAIQGTSPETYEEQVISAVNCGMDMLMEGERYDETRQIIINAVTNGRILLERIDDAATRIIRVKKNVGLFEDPFCINMTAGSEEPGSMKHRAVAEQLVEKSLVLLKNENRILPLKKGTKVYITGPSADDPRAQCGGWTMGWNASPTKNIPGVTTILEAFVRYADTYDIEVITDPSQAETADVVLLCVGEQAYAEWFGDTYDLSLCGKKGLGSNRRAMDAVKSLGKPTVTCIIAGRHVLIEKDDYNQWDSLVMCYLPGSEGKGISDVLCGCSDFSGRLPEPWYESVNQIGQDECWFEIGYGMSYQDGFVPVKEPEAVPDP